MLHILCNVFTEWGGRWSSQHSFQQWVWGTSSCCNFCLQGFGLSAFHNGGPHLPTITRISSYHEQLSHAEVSVPVFVILCRYPQSLWEKGSSQLLDLAHQKPWRLTFPNCVIRVQDCTESRDVYVMKADKPQMVKRHQTLHDIQLHCLLCYSGAQIRK